MIKELISKNERQVEIYWNGTLRGNFYYRVSPLLFLRGASISVANYRLTTVINPSSNGSAAKVQ